MEQLTKLLLAHPWTLALGLALLVASIEDARNPGWYYKRLWSIETAEGARTIQEPLSRVGDVFTRFHQVVDRLFGKSVPLPRRLWRSSVASLIGMAAAWLTAALFFTDWAEYYDDEFKTLTWRDLRSFALIYAIGIGTSFPLAILPDFLSLEQTRHFVAWAARTRGTARIAGILLLDLLVTSVIVLTLGTVACCIALWLSFCLYAGKWLEFSLDADLGEIYRYLATSVQLSAAGGGPHGIVVPLPPMAPAFYSGYVTSVWLCIYVGSRALGHTLKWWGGATAPAASPEERWLDPVKHPLKALVLAMSVPYGLVVGIGWILSRLAKLATAV